jgi:oligopeptidase B
MSETAINTSPDEETALNRNLLNHSYRTLNLSNEGNFITFSSFNSKKTKRIIVLTFILAAVFCVVVLSNGTGSNLKQSNVPNPPKTLSFQKILHGDIWSDEFNWLSNIDDPDTSAYIETENKYADSILSTEKETMDYLKREWERLENSYVGGTKLSNGLYMKRFFYYADNSNDLPLLYRDSLSENITELLFDCSTIISEADYFALGFFEVSIDEKYLAFGYDTIGNERFTLVVFDIINKRVIKTATNMQLYYDLKWTNSNDILFTTVDRKGLPRQVYRYKLDNSTELIYNENDEALVVSLAQRDGVLSVICSGQVTNEIHIYENDTLRLLFPRKINVQYFVACYRENILVMTNEHQRNNEIILVDKSLSLIRTIVKASDRYLTGFDVFNDRLAVWFWERGYKDLQAIDLLTNHVYYPFHNNITNPSSSLYLPSTYAMFPGASEDGAVTRNYKENYILFNNRSFIQPVHLYEMNLMTFEINIIHQDIYKEFKSSEYDTKTLVIDNQGSNIKLSMVYRKGELKNRPLILKAYGAYGGMIEPDFNYEIKPLLDKDIVLVMAHIRGDADFGPVQYHSGKYEFKINTMKDFEYVIDYLIENGYTTYEKLSIWGRSAGGILMGYAINKFSHKFLVAILQVPFVDAIGSMTNPEVPWTIYEYFEWGNPMNNQTIYQAMKEYSPYDNVNSGLKCNCLFIGGLNDARVGYYEPTKMVARIRRISKSSKVLLKVFNYGHFASDSNKKDEAAFIYAFILKNLNNLF